MELRVAPTASLLPPPMEAQHVISQTMPQIPRRAILEHVQPLRQLQLSKQLPPLLQLSQLLPLLQLSKLLPLLQLRQLLLLLQLSQQLLLLQLSQLPPLLQLSQLLLLLQLSQQVLNRLAVAEPTEIPTDPTDPTDLETGTGEVLKRISAIVMSTIFTSRFLFLEATRSSTVHTKFHNTSEWSRSKKSKLMNETFYQSISGITPG
jgi:hypothetical protein